MNINKEKVDAVNTNVPVLIFPYIILWCADTYDHNLWLVITTIYSILLLH